MRVSHHVEQRLSKILCAIEWKQIFALKTDDIIDQTKFFIKEA